MVASTQVTCAKFCRMKRAVMLALALSFSCSKGSSRSVGARELEQSRGCWLDQKVVGDVVEEACSLALTYATRGGKCFLFNDSCVPAGFLVTTSSCAPPSAGSCSPPTNAQAGEGPEAALPAQSKGYELYAWRDKDEDWFTLIPGTNRSKLVAEVAVKNANLLREDGWVVLSVEGPDALRKLVTRIPPSTEVVLQKLDGLAPIGNDVRETALEILQAR